MKIKHALVIFAAVLVSQIAFADEPGYESEKPKKRRGRPVPPPQQYEEPYDQQYGQYEQFAPGGQYLCNPGCPPPPIPLPLAPVPPIILAPPPVIMAPPPVLPPPVLPFPPMHRPMPIPTPYGGGGHWGGGQWGGPRPTPYGGFQRMSAKAGCEVQQGNNGQFVVISPADQVIFENSSEKASEYAEQMKLYYEKNGFCGASDKRELDI